MSAPVAGGPRMTLQAPPVAAAIPHGSRPLFSLGRAAEPERRTLFARRDLCVGPPGNVFLFGGIGLGAALTAVQEVTGLPVIWSTCQFLGHVRPEEVLALDVQTPVQGRNVTQARISGRVGDREVLNVSAALGRKDHPVSRQWVSAPEVPPPEACVASPGRNQAPGTLMETLEMRTLPGAPDQRRTEGGVSDSSRTIFWMRTRERIDVDASLLALFADFVPNAVGATLGSGLGGTSLDNTLRIVRPVATEWVLVEAHVQSAHAGFAHGDLALFARDGQLMAVASQTINIWTPKPAS